MYGWMEVGEDATTYYAESSVVVSVVTLSSQAGLGYHDGMCPNM